jgi:hypothetical protein
VAGEVIIGRVGYHPPNFTPVRCDRNINSALKNPFSSGTRDENCDQFQLYYHEQMGLVRSALRVAVSRIVKKLLLGENIYLQCHCTGIGRCHTETIKADIERRII